MQKILKHLSNIEGLNVNANVPRDHIQLAEIHVGRSHRVLKLQRIATASQYGTDMSDLASVSYETSNSLLTSTRPLFHISTRGTCAEVAMKTDSINTVSAQLDMHTLGDVLVYSMLQAQVMSGL